MDRERVVIAEIVRPRGNRGEVIAHSQTDVPGRLESLKRAQVRLRDGFDVRVEVEEAWEHKGLWVFKFAQVDSIDAAERFNDSEIWVAAGERAQLPPGEFFESDLMGCTVIDRVSGRRLGTVEEWHRFGGAPLMQVEVDGRELLIPFVASESRVDVAGRTIEVSCPDGLLEL